MKKEENLQAKNIKDFTSEDTIYIRYMADTQKPLFLCKFISFDKGSVTGQAISIDVNRDIWKYRIEEGFTITAKLENCALYGTTSEGGQPHYHFFNTLGYALDPLDLEKEDVNGFHQPNHESYAMIGASRRSSSHSQALFGSSIKHSNTITIRIHTAEHDRAYNRDRIHAKKEILEIEMSSTQWAEFISTLNVGDGVPCTLTRLQGKRMQEPPFQSKAEMIQDEFSAKMRNFSVDLRKMIQESIELLKNKPTLTKGDRTSILDSINSMIQQIQSNIPFVGEQFQKQMERTVIEAKNEVEAFIDNKVYSTGIKALNNPEVLKRLKEGNSFE